MEPAVQALQNYMNEMLQGKLLANMKSIDGLIQAALDENEERFGWKNVTHFTSFALAKAAAYCEGNSEIYEGLYKRIRGKAPGKLQDYGFPGLAITLLRGGKAINSKVKVRKLQISLAGLLF